MGEREIEVSGDDSVKVTERFDDLVSRFYVDGSDTFQQKVSHQNIHSSSPASENTGAGISLSKFAAQAGVSVEELGNVYDFRKDDLLVHYLLTGSDAEKQKQMTKLVLIASILVYGQEPLSGKALGKHMSEQKIGSMGNFSKNLKKEPGIKVLKNFYSLNTIGKQEALTLVRQLCTKK